MIISYILHIIITYFDIARVSDLAARIFAFLSHVHILKYRDKHMGLQTLCIFVFCKG